MELSKWNVTFSGHCVSRHCQNINKNHWPHGNFADFAVPLQEHNRTVIIIDNIIS